MKEKINQNNANKERGLSWEGITGRPSNKEDGNGVEEKWSKFKNYFWVIFVVKLITTYGIVKSEAWTNFVFYTLDLEETHLIIINLLLQFIPVALMVYVMGYYAYKISGSRKKIWKGLWGLLWFGIIAIFIGYYAVKRERDRKLQTK